MLNWNNVCFNSITLLHCLFIPFYFFFILSLLCTLKTFLKKTPEKYDRILKEKKMIYIFGKK